MDTNMPPPKHVVIGIDSRCNLRCPACPTGVGKLALRTGTMRLDTFKRVLERLPNLERLSLSFIGESLLNREFSAIARFAAERGVEVWVDTHLSLPLPDVMVDGVLNSGLYCLQASIDGVTQDVYGAYRRNGKVELALGNLRRLRERQVELGGVGPVLVWKFVVNAYNEHELETARSLAAAMGVAFRVEPFCLPNDCPDVDMLDGRSLDDLKHEWLPANPEYILPGYQGPSDYIYAKTCPWLFGSMVIHDDGTVLPCCYVASASSSFGNILQHSLEEIWTSEKYRYARSVALGQPSGQRHPVPCESCKVFQPPNPARRSEHRGEGQ